MKSKSIATLIIAFFMGLSCSELSAQNEPRFDLYFLAGLNLGATTPVPLPGALKITQYNPRLNPKFGANLIYRFDRHWGVGTGLTMDWKSMKVKTKVTDVHLRIDVPAIGTLTGYVTGRNTTKVNTLYLTQPLYGTYRFNRKWEVKLGVYMAETLSRKFKGDVHDVSIAIETPLTQVREIPFATLDYSKDVRGFDFGMLAGGEFRMNSHVGFYADFTWGLRPYFSSTVPIHFTMRNIYFSLGVTYRI